MHLVPMPAHVCFIPLNTGVKTSTFTGKSVAAKSISDFLII